MEIVLEHKQATHTCDEGKDVKDVKKRENV